MIEASRSSVRRSLSALPLTTSSSSPSCMPAHVWIIRCCAVIAVAGSCGGSSIRASSAKAAAADEAADDAATLTVPKRAPTGLPLPASSSSSSSSAPSVAATPHSACTAPSTRSHARRCTSCLGFRRSSSRSCSSAARTSLWASWASCGSVGRSLTVSHASCIAQPSTAPLPNALPTRISPRRPEVCASYNLVTSSCGDGSPFAPGFTDTTRRVVAPDALELVP